MVSKTNKGQKESKVKVGKLKLNKTTVKALTSNQEKQIKGGLRRKTPSEPCSSGCPTWDDGCE